MLFIKYGYQFEFLEYEINLFPAPSIGREKRKINYSCIFWNAVLVYLKSVIFLVRAWPVFKETLIEILSLHRTKKGGD